jgi:threonine dehydratase
MQEKIIRFEFPETPGASIKFLDVLSGNGDFNISLFHYRNHGSDMGRVLAGFQLKPE